MKDYKERFKKEFVKDANFYSPAPEIRTQWLVPYVETSAENLINFIEQIISERDKEIRKEYADYSTWTCGVCGEENLKGDPTKHKC